MAISKSNCAGLLPLPYVQFWKTENTWRLDRSYCGGHRRDIPCLVDVTDVRTLSATRNPTPWSVSAMGMLRQLTSGRRARHGQNSGVLQVEQCEADEHRGLDDVDPGDRSSR